MDWGAWTAVPSPPSVDIRTVSVFPIKVSPCIDPVLRPSVWVCAWLEPPGRHGEHLHIRPVIQVYTIVLFPPFLTSLPGGPLLLVLGAFFASRSLFLLQPFFLSAGSVCRNMDLSAYAKASQPFSVRPPLGKWKYFGSTRYTPPSLVEWIVINTYLAKNAFLSKNDDATID